MDLTGLFRGELSLRRVLTLIRGLQPGSALARAEGGDAAWSDVTAATLISAWQIQTAVLSAAGVKQSKLPKPPKPPEEGWMEKAEEKQRREEEKLRNWLERNPDVVL